MGATSANLLALSSGVQSVSAVGQGYAQSQALKARGDYESRMMELNARRAELSAADAIRRGEKDATEVKKQAKKLVGSQRAAMAAQGIVLDDGSALDIQEDTAAMGAEDAMTVRNNAWREAWGFRTQASDYRGQAKFARMAARNEARTTLLTGGMRALGYGAEAVGHYQKGKGK